jgi:predicted ArsR family transcriptional regulator
MRVDARHPHSEQMDQSTLVHKALAEPTRATLYEILRTGDRACSVAELAGGLGVHPNTVRSHLQILEEAGLAVSTSEKRLRPGRPRRLFDAVRDASEEDHRLLAGALAGVLEPLADGTSLAEEAGRQWGRRLAETLPSASDTPVAQVVALLDRRGFAATTDEEDIMMQRCPFHEVAEDHPRIVCGFHAGLIDGALEQAGAAVRLESLDPWAREGACVAHLTPRAAG